VRRAKAWAALTGGGQIDFFHFEIFDFARLASPDAANGMKYIGLQRTFLADLGIDLAGMIPVDGDVTGGWALGRPGSEYIIYLPAGGATSVPALANPGRAVWFNPRDGSSIPAANAPLFTAPDTNDWVLYLQR
jgi:Putative collagen-binding domain of a collagenase